MATDVARLSYDPARRYTGVVTQQGRVALEAEQNEERVIGAEERREVLLDVVGRAGTPDDGYAVSAGPGTDLVVGPGTMYVGGLRVTLDDEILTSEQPDWLDQPVADERPLGREHVLLLLTEHDVTAVEDPALLEVALGGPDGAARTRVVQRVLRHTVDATTCADALEESVRDFARDGLTFEPETMRLASTARLRVSWRQDPDAGSACEPSSTGGYLGAENQCIRFQVTAVRRDGTFDAVWGYDDASHLYRVTPDKSVNPVLTLDRSPVDDHHRPRTGQAVQVLRSTAVLVSADQVAEGFVAATGGVVAVLPAPYDPDGRTVRLPAPLPADYAADPRLYLRVWEEHLTGLTLGTPVDLTGTGMQVTLSSTRAPRLHVDDFWCIGVRPETPTAVYPARYLRTPQPPDGPRQWVCPLAVVDRVDQGVLDVVEDCRRPFDPLTEIEPGGGCCCTVEVRPEDAPRLQAIIDRAVANRSIKERADRVTVCFEQGRYELREPIVLREQHSNLVLSGCGAAVLTVDPGLGDERLAAFGQGLIVLVEADDVTIAGFELELPQVPFEFGRVSGVAGGAYEAATVRAVNDEAPEVRVSIGVRPVNCAVLAVTGCVFRYTLGDDRPSSPAPRSVLGVGVLAAGALWGLRLTDNRFLHDAFDTVPPEGGAIRLLAGLLHSQVSLSREARHRKVRSLGAARLPALLDDAVIARNRFAGLSTPALVVADLGQVTVQDNHVEDCYGGFWFVESAAFAGTDVAGRSDRTTHNLAATQLAAGALGAGMLDSVLVYLLQLATLYPLPDPDERPKGYVAEEPAHTRKYFADAQEAAGASTAALVERFVAEQPEEGKEALRDEGAAGTKATRKRRAAGDSATAGATARAEAPARAGARARLAVSVVIDADPEVVETPQMLTMQPEPLVAVLGGLVALERLRDDDGPGRGLRTTLNLASNTVECTTPNRQAGGPALFVYNYRPVSIHGFDVDGSASAVTGNRFVSHDATFAVVVIGLGSAAITGNVIAGARDDRRASLAVGAVGAAAITGNVVAGRAILPGNRPFPAPLDTWYPFNTIG
ncbi:DUF6519 domain-containing protein [Antribacter gilvus]|uniref:DUF6519 domain-containing protein n=1 Tax=Antribacter gilvus TaxID=2304675 RepID=UPI000F7B3550|nr:DUF6519 domain-containing protein [Antribacter gilvus]